MVTPIEGLDPVEELGFGIEAVHGEGRNPSQSRPGDKSRVDLEILGYVLVAEIQDELSVTEVVVQAQGMSVVVSTIPVALSE